MRIFTVLIFALLPMTINGLTDCLSEENESDRESFQFLISNHSDNYSTAQAYLKENFPDILIIDNTFLDHKRLFEFINNISKSTPRTKKVIYSSSDNPFYFKCLLGYGIKSIISKGITKEELKEGLDVIATTGIYIDKRIANSILKRKITGNSSYLKDTKLLTGKEKEIISYIQEGLPRREIAQRLDISVKTVSQHEENIKEKLDIKSVNEIHKILR